MPQRATRTKAAPPTSTIGLGDFMTAALDVSVMDELDDISRGFLRVADQLWAEARTRRVSHRISLEDYDEVRAHCRSLVRRSAEIVASASALRNQQSAEARSALAGMTAALERVQRDIVRVQSVLQA